REYVMGVLVAPSIATVVWFSVLGGTSLDLQLSGARDIAAAAGESAQAALFEVLEGFPLASVTSLAVVILAAVFFVSGADAGAIVLGTFSSRGDQNPKKWLTISWGLLVGLVALALLIVGGLDALQWGAIVVASPFVVVLIAMCVALLKELLADAKQMPRSGRAARRAEQPPG
ncbi:MAG: BCCT family transporter, partial [Thermocrispum sp.]